MQFFRGISVSSLQPVLMKQRILCAIAVIALCNILISCQKDSSGALSTAKLVFVFRFDSTQVRLNNIGQSEPIPAGNAGQSPRFNNMSAHYVELAPNMLTGLGKGTVLYMAPETTSGGTRAIDFEKSKPVANGETFLSLPLKDITPGEYEWLRLSLAYQNYDISYHIDTVIAGTRIRQDLNGTVASFIGYNTYLKNFMIKSQSIPVNGNRKQGYWGFETMVPGAGTTTLTGQAPEGSTTVVNPLFATSPVPQGSCVVTAAFAPGKLKITGKETADIVVEVVLSTNKSFEWKEVVQDNKWEPGKGEQVVDMGIRGMIPKIR